MKDYIENVKITEQYDIKSIQNRLNSTQMIRLLHSAMGMSTESGEFLDMLKKHIYYGKDLDVTNIIEEIGDCLWYCAIALDELGVDFSHVMDINIKKLKLRYPDGFSKDNAINRDLQEERKILESW